MDHKVATEQLNAENKAGVGSRPLSAPDIIKTHYSGTSPLESVAKCVKQNMPKEADRKNEEVFVAYVEVPEPAPEPCEPAPTVNKKPTKTSSLLAKCMPYIYDDDGVNYAEEKPDYKLESVEDIIESAERRASEKIARMYNLKAESVENIGSEKPLKPEKEEPQERPRLKLEKSSIKKSFRIGEHTKIGSATFDTVSIPKVTSTLFDDFSSRRTEVSDNKNVVTTYTELGNIQSGNDENHARHLPDLKPEGNTARIFEDIISHTRPMNVEDVPATIRPSAAGISEDEFDTPRDEYRGHKDVKRIGLSLKADLVFARLRSLITLILAIITGILILDPVKEWFDSDAVIPCIIAIVSFGLAVLINSHIFASFKGAFTKRTKIEFPLVLAVIAMSMYLVFGIISGEYPFEATALTLVSLFSYNICDYKRASAVFSNFKLIATKTEKTAVTLIDNQGTAAAMARGSIEGDILVAGSEQTDSISDFMKHTFSDLPFAAKLPALTIASLVTSAVIAICVGVSYGSFVSALGAFAIALALSAGPTMFIADMLPFAFLSDKLRKFRAGVCSKYSAETIEQLNAVALSSKDLFPEGSIKLFNISPLSSNTIDETILLATSVAKEAGSPLYPMFKKMLGGDTPLPPADSVKYEDNLGISGWVDDKYIMIGNRSHMQAHGIRIPALEVDRKILHKGYFPVYVSCDQRACALLVVKYSADAVTEAELRSLTDKGVTLLIDNCDPNITDEMLCDYFSIHPDLVRILDHHGSHKYKLTTEKKNFSSAHAFYKGTARGFLAILNGSIRLRTLSSALSALHIIASVLLWLVFTGLSLGGAASLMGASLCLLCEAVGLVVSLMILFILKP